MVNSRLFQAARLITIISVSPRSLSLAKELETPRRHWKENLKHDIWQQFCKTCNFYRMFYYPLLNSNRILIIFCCVRYSCTAFAYGQTGSGKTYTITGPLNLVRVCSCLSTMIRWTLCHLIRGQWFSKCIIISLRRISMPSTEVQPVIYNGNQALTLPVAQSCESHQPCMQCVLQKGRDLEAENLQTSPNHFQRCVLGKDTN